MSDLETRIVRINGTPLRVLWDELPDPHPDGYGPARSPSASAPRKASRP